MRLWRALRLIAVGIFGLALASLRPLPPLGADSLAGQGVAMGPERSTTVVSSAPYIDDEGYTIWSCPLISNWCVLLSGIRWPIDLGTQDPLAIEDATLTLRFKLGRTFPWLEADPVWTVHFNPTWSPTRIIQGREVGNISGPVDVWSTEVLPIDPSWILDGENNVFLINLGPDAGVDYCTRCKGSCIEVGEVYLRGRVDPTIDIQSVSPQSQAKNVDWENPGISVQFTKPYSRSSINLNTFQVWYYDQNFQPVYVDGTFEHTPPTAPTKATFVPRQKLKDGVLYLAKVWGQDDAEAEGRTEWVESAWGSPLERGTWDWKFWTMPDLQVNLVPVQVLEGATLVAEKATVLKTFVRWERKPEVHRALQADEVEIDDIRVSWAGPPGCASAQAWWKKDPNQYDWRPLPLPEAMVRKREYREFTGNSNESYTKAEKLEAKDSINYFAFRPDCAGAYTLMSTVFVKDDQGRLRQFRKVLETVPVQASRPYRVHFRPVAKGTWVTRTTPVDLSQLIGDNLSRMRAVFPTSWVYNPVAGSNAMNVYIPTRDSWLNNEMSDLMIELSEECERDQFCDLMVGVVPHAWLGMWGLSEAENRLGWDKARHGVLVAHDALAPEWDFIVAHEAGHVIHDSYDWADDDPPVPAGEGFDVLAKQDKRTSVTTMYGRPLIPWAIHNLMKEDPFDNPGEPLWIAKAWYDNLLDEFRVASSLSVRDISTQPLLLASGIIAVPTDTVTLRPWYMLEPGTWEAPVSGDYAFLLLDGSSNVLASHPFRRGSVKPGGLSYFAVKVPYPSATAKMQIKHGATVIKEVTLSPNPPTLNITAPVAGATWTGTQTIAWTGSDPDGDALRYGVDVSADNGASWQPLAINLTGNSLVWDTSSITSTSTALVRVSATDGLRTTMRTAGPFTVTNPPAASYILPSNGITNVNTTTPIVVGFSEDMDPTTIHSNTIIVRGGPFITVAGVLTYASATREATFVPRVPLAYSTNYTVTVTTGARSKRGVALAAPKLSSFRTEEDASSPRAVAFSPSEGELQAPLNTWIAVAWDKALNAGTLTAARFIVARIGGGPVTGTVGYDTGTKTATFTPNADLSANTWYSVTLKAGIEDLAGHATEGDYAWAFRTGRQRLQSHAFTRSFDDYPLDDNGDGLYDRLVVRVGVQVTVAGTYVFKGTLVDSAGEEITWVTATVSLGPGVGFAELAFPGAPIRGHGVDGPYTLTDLNFYKRGDARPAAWLRDAYRTHAYLASQFSALLTFGGLPDVELLPYTTLDRAFNVRDYAHHQSLPSSQLNYTITMRTNTLAGVTLGADGYVNIHPRSGWTGTAEVTIQASAGTDYAQDTFRVSVGVGPKTYLPLVSRLSGLQARVRNNWKTALADGFEGDLLWAIWSRISYDGGPRGWYCWGKRDCQACSGRYSMWAMGGCEDGSRLACGSEYLNRYETGMMYRPAINLKYVGAAEFRMKVWTDLGPGDSVCAMATIDEYGEIYDKRYYGVCKSGTSQGWEDLVLDLSNVPTLGNLLGREKIWVAVKFISDSAGTRPIGAYVDDILLRVCPAGLTCR